MITPIERRRLSDRVVDQFADLIASGVFAVGDKLPSERELAASLGVSRPLIRESFRTLESMGLVEVKRGVGAIVTRASPAGEAAERHPVEYPPGAQDSADQGGVLLRLERATILDILEAREVLEVQIVALAAERITPEEADWLREASERNQSWDDNHEFHTLLASITHNFMLERLVVMQLDLLRDARQRTHYESPSNAERLLREHRAIADAVIEHDIERAQNLMREHFRHTRHSVVSSSGGVRQEDHTE